MGPIRIMVPGTVNRYVLINIEQDEFAQNPRKEFCNAGTMVCFHGRYALGDEDHGIQESQFESWGELETYLWKKKNAAVVLPLYMLDHSGITISTTPFGCPWDSGQIGFIYISKEDAVAEWGKKICTKEVIKKATAYLQSEVETYNQYLTGDVWGFTVEDREAEVDLTEIFEDDWEDESRVNTDDSCYGFYGFDYAEQEAYSGAFGYVLEWMTPNGIKELLEGSCSCEENDCLECYVTKTATGLLLNPNSPAYFKHIDHHDPEQVAKVMFARYSNRSDKEMIKEGAIARVCDSCLGYSDKGCEKCHGTGLVSLKGQLELAL